MLISSGDLGQNIRSHHTLQIRDAFFYFLLIYIFLFLQRTTNKHKGEKASENQTHTHTHTQRERDETESSRAGTHAFFFFYTWSTQMFNKVLIGIILNEIHLTRLFFNIHKIHTLLYSDLREVCHTHTTHAQT